LQLIWNWRIAWNWNCVNQGLNPHSRIDVQGFIWASIGIEDGKYGSTD